MPLPSTTYSSLIRRGILKHDMSQLKCITQFIDPLYYQICEFSPTAISRSFCSHNIKGLYLWGGVGCGKTFLMDLFRKSLPNNVDCCRMHFHTFMKDVHRLLHTQRLTRNNGIDLKSVVNKVVSNAPILCFDEMMVNDIADAMLLKKIFQNLFDRGICLVTTSNQAPSDLYANGLNRDQFLPFVKMIEENCYVHSMNSIVDYRQNHGDQSTSASYYFSSSNTKEKARFEKSFRDLTQGKKATVFDLYTEFGRKLTIPKTVLSCNVCRFTFTQLFRKELSAIDYEAIGKMFHTIFIENIPQLSFKQANEVRRMINALDIFYQYKVKLIILADAKLESLFLEKGDVIPSQNFEVSDEFQVFTTEDEQFMIKRTLSRLKEMQSSNYMNEKWCGNSL